tara:strand:+ start:4182 stop:4712 length:531 start_codon:yes stop_codon:yes gene_type:complete
MKQGEVQKLLDDFRDKVIKEAKKGLPRDTGSLAKSLKSYVKESKNSIQISFTMNEYGFYQDRGVKGVRSGKSLSGYQFGTGSGKKGGLTKGINEWVQRKQIQFRDRDTGRFMSYDQTARTIIRSIWQKGIKPSMFFTRPFEKYYRKLPKQVTEKYALDMVNLFNTITSENFKKLAK